MATHSSVLAWRIPGTVEPGGLPSMGSHRVGHDWSDLAAATAVKGYGFTSGHVWMWELDYKESWVVEELMLLNVLEKTLESPLDCKEIQPVHPKAYQSWVFIGRTDVEAETPILWPPDAKSWLIGKDPDAAKDWRQEEKGTTEDEMVGWHHQLNGHGFGWNPGVVDGQGGLECCGHGVAKSWHNWATELNWTELRRVCLFVCLFYCLGGLLPK